MIWNSGEGVIRTPCRRLRKISTKASSVHHYHASASSSDLLIRCRNTDLSLPEQTVGFKQGMYAPWLYLLCATSFVTKVKICASHMQRTTKYVINSAPKSCPYPKHLQKNKQNKKEKVLWGHMSLITKNSHTLYGPHENKISALLNKRQQDGNSATHKSTP